MAPHNITTLLDTRWCTHKLETAKSKGDQNRVNKFRQHLRYQHYQLALLQNELEKSDLLHDLLVTLTVTDQIREGKRNFDLALIDKIFKTLFLNNQKQMKNINPNLRRQLLIQLGLSNFTIEIINKQLHSNLAPVLLRFVRDFSRYRQDLQLYHQAQQSINRISFIESEKDILTSRANRSLYEFLTLDESDQSDDSELIHHAILKADLRGSTRITEELNKKGLNPATHFSRNFFDPINEILPQYGAEKVFIEGDALILIFNEHSDMHSSHLCVSHACGVATDMLRIVDRQNRILEKYKLPILELGIGIAYNDTPPRYLFDDDSKITISPAINRADRLSSCAWAIKTWLAGKIEKTMHVAMYEPSANARSIGAKAEKEMIYNLNGILLEDSAYKKLSSEIRLKRIKNEIKSLQDSDLLASKYADSYGTMHTIIVRSAPVRVYDPAYEYTKAPEVKGRRYHEVIHDKELINQIIAQKKITRPDNNG
jgi:class 3 adenylate cyclase